MAFRCGNGRRHHRHRPCICHHWGSPLWHAEFKNSLVSVILGSIVYRFVIAIVLQMGMPPNDLKLFTSVLVVIALALPMMRDKVQRRKVG